MIRSISTCTVLAAVLFVGVWKSSSLPAPSECSDSQLLMWIARPDLSQQPSETLSALVDRVQEEAASGGLAGNSAPNVIPNVWKHRIESNVELLKRVWFADRVRQFTALELEQRRPFLDRQLEFVEFQSNNGLGGAPAGILELCDQTDRWMSEAAPDDALLMSDAVAAAVGRWLETRDVATLQPADRETLTERVAAFLSEGAAINPGEAVGEPSEQSQLRNNAVGLIQTWFNLRSREFHQLQVADRSKFVEQKLDQVRGWKLETLFSGSSGNVRGFLQIVSLVDQWIKQANDDEQAELLEFKQAIEKVVFREMIFGKQR